MIAAYASALSGLDAARTSFAERADRIVKSTSDPDQGSALSGNSQATGPPIAVFPAVSDQRDNELVSDIVCLSLDKTAFKANLAVLRSAREMEERLLDIIT